MIDDGIRLGQGPWLLITATIAGSIALVVRFRGGRL